MKLAKAARPRRIPIRGSMEAVAALIERAIELAFLDAVARAVGGHDLRRIAEIARRLSRGIPLSDSYVLGAYQWAVLETELARALVHIERGVEGGGAVARQALAEKMGLEIEAQLKLMNPHAVRAARMSAARMVTNVTRETMLGIRAIVVRAQMQGIAIEAQAAQIEQLLRQGFGLTVRDATALSNYQANLIKQGVSGERLETLVTRQRDRYLERRALVIAREESLGAVRRGNHAIWREAVDQGLLPVDVKRRWLTAKGDRVCPVCRPMDGQVRGLEEPFVSPYDGSETNEDGGVHILCRCTTTLVIPDA